MRHAGTRTADTNFVSPAVFCADACIYAREHCDLNGGELARISLGAESREIVRLYIEFAVALGQPLASLSDLSRVLCRIMKSA